MGKYVQKYKDRREKVVEKILGLDENNLGSKITVTEALRAYGFSPSYVKNPKQFVSTKKFQELLAERVSDDLMTRKHNDLFHAGKIQHYIFPKLSHDVVEKKIIKGKKVTKTKTVEKQELTNEEIKVIVESVPGCRLIYIRRDFLGAWAFYLEPDNKAVDNALEKAYKLKGYYAAEKVAIVDPLDELSNAELVEAERKLIEGLTNKRKR